MVVSWNALPVEIKIKECDWIQKQTDNLQTIEHRRINKLKLETKHASRSMKIYAMVSVEQKKFHQIKKKHGTTKKLY